MNILALHIYGNIARDAVTCWQDQCTTVKVQKAAEQWSTPRSLLMLMWIAYVAEKHHAYRKRECLDTLHAMSVSVPVLLMRLGVHARLRSPGNEMTPPILQRNTVVNN